MKKKLKNRGQITFCAKLFATITIESVVDEKLIWYTKVYTIVNKLLFFVSS